MTSKHCRRPGAWVLGLLLAACLMAGGLSSVAEGADQTVKVMAYNIRHGADASSRVDLAVTAAAIRAVAPDVLFLSEVDQYWRRSGLVDQPQQLSQALAMPHVHFAPALTSTSPLFTARGHTARYGNAFLSKIPFRDAGAVSLPRQGVNEPRNVVWVDVDAGGDTLRIYGTHLSLDARERSLQLKALGQLVAASPFPALIVGDFNAPPERLKNEAPFLWQPPWYDAHGAKGDREDGLTFPAPVPTTRIDYIFIHEALMPRLFRVTTPTVGASDHFPVVVELTVD